MKAKRQRANFAFTASLVFLVGCWFVTSAFGLVDSLFLPSPRQIASSFVRLCADKAFGLDIVMSIYRVFVAFGISVLIAIPLALVMSQYSIMHRLVGPYIDFIRYLPVPTLVPLTILFFGIGETAKIVLLFIGTFFQLILLLIDDLNDVPNEYIDISYTLKFSEGQVMLLKLRSILPQLYDNCRITLGWCWTYLIIAELVASEVGIGHMIKEAQRFSNTADVYIGIITMGIIGFGTDFIFKRWHPVLFKYKQFDTNHRS